MGVPESIRSVKRPVNTVVVDNGRDGPNRWAVRERAFVRYAPGMKNPQPHSGKTIGHIVDGMFVPIVQPTNDVVVPDCLQYGAGTLIRTVVGDIEEDLLQVFPPRTALAILTIATLRVIEPGVPDKRLRYFYNKSVVSQHYPGAFLSAKTVHNLYEDLGTSMERRAAFSLKRLERVSAEHHIAIDGMLKQDNGTVNDLGAYTGKSRIRGRMEISILYALDIELGEVICGEVFPGNFVDMNAYAPFIEHNHITKGIIVDDKGFPPDKIKEIIKKNPDLHYLTPIKRNDKRIKQYNMTDYEGVLSGFDRTIFYKKKQIAPKQFLYSFMDPRRALGEQNLFASRAVKNGLFDAKKFADKRNTYGVIVFESDIDIAPEVAYKSYDDRWKIEMVFHEYKSALELDETRVQGDFTVVGSDFINLISSMITTRLLKKMQEANLFEKYTYRDIMIHLKAAWRQVNAPDPMIEDHYWIHTNKEDFEVLERLGLATPNPQQEPKHPKKTNRSKKTESSGHETAEQNAESNKKNDTLDGSRAEKRKPGRPRTHPPKDPEAPKRPRGRPRIHPPKDPNAPKRPRGRPRKDSTAPTVATDVAEQEPNP